MEGGGREGEKRGKVEERGHKAGRTTPLLVMVRYAFTQSNRNALFASSSPSLLVGVVWAAEGAAVYRLNRIGRKFLAKRESLA